MAEIKQLHLPISEEELCSLRAGDIVEITGVVYTSRDAAHKRFCELLAAGKELPIPVAGLAMYYVGPTPAKPGRVIGSAGPTSSYRMDAYSEPLLQQGLKIMIGKGTRSQALKDMLVKYKAVYISAVGGAAAAISNTIKKCDLICYEDLGAEAVRRMEVERFFGIVAYDTVGGDLFQNEMKKYRKI